MNILIVCDYFLDYLGGAQTAMAAQAGALRAAGHTVTLVAPVRRRAARLASGSAGSNDASFSSPLVLPVLDMAVVRNNAATRERIRRLISDLSIDVVHVHSEFGLAVAAVEVAAQLGIPSVQTIHTFYWRAGLPSWGLVARLMGAAYRLVSGLRLPSARLSANRIDDSVRRMTLALARTVDAVVSPSAHQAQDLRTAGVSHVELVPNCVPRGSGRDARQLDGSSGPLRLLWIGRCIGEKRVLEFTRAAVIASDVVGPDRLEVTIAGTGPELGRVRAIAGHSAAIRILGRVANSAVPALLAAHDATVLSSLGYDNQPMTVAESITALRGVLYVDARIQEGLDAAGVFLDDPGVGGMAAALVELAHDRGPVVAASERALRVRHIFSAEAHAAALERIYSTLRADRARLRTLHTTEHPGVMRR